MIYDSNVAIMYNNITVISYCRHFYFLPENKNLFTIIQQYCYIQQVRYEDEDEDEGPQPDATLEQGAPLPVRLVGTFPPELASVPLEDIDPYYHNQKVSTRCQFPNQIPNSNTKR